MYLSHRVDRTYADSLSRTDVLFKIFHVRSFFKEKAMYAVMPCGFAVFDMDAAPRHNHDIIKTKGSSFKSVGSRLLAA